MKPWEKQDDESAESYARFCIYLELGHGRSLTRAYKLAHPDSTSDVVSSSWRREYKEHKWCERATDYSLSLFREESKRTLVLISRACRAYARKSLKALLSKDSTMAPRTWEESQKAFEFLFKLLPPETVNALVMADDTPDTKTGIVHGPEDYDADGFLKEIPESYYAAREEAEFMKRTGQTPPPPKPPA